MAADAFSFFVSHVQVELRCAHAPTLAAMRAVWGGCDRPLIATGQRAGFAVEREAGGYAISGPHGTRHCDEPLDVLPLLEAALYAAMHEWHAHLLALHAACVSGPLGSWVLLGRSGSGKSSLARAAVQLGLQYFSDEVVLCDGAQLWGVPRAIQFAPLADGVPPPSWLGAVDLTSYCLRVAEGRNGVMPLWRPRSSALARAPVPAHQARVYAIERAGDGGLQPLSTVALLAAIHEAAYQPPAFDLGPLAHPGRSGLLRWSDPGQAIAQLLRAAE